MLVLHGQGLDRLGLAGKHGCQSGCVPGGLGRAKTDRDPVTAAAADAGRVGGPHVDAGPASLHAASGGCVVVEGRLHGCAVPDPGDGA